MQALEERKVRRLEIVCSIIFFAIIAGLVVWGMFPEKIQNVIALIF